MGLLDELSSLERQRFFHGQRLLASDLNELEAFHRELRELHNKSLHQPGIGNGFAVSGSAGERELTIGPGYGIDAEGREIVLTADQVEPVPPVAGEDDGGPATYDLTISHKDEDLEEVETRDGICLPGGAVRLLEEPVFCWVRLVEDLNGKLVPADDELKADIEAGLKLRVARVEVLDCALASLSVAQRLDARPPTQPRIECGSASPLWQESAELAQNPKFVAPFVLKATIDTSEKGFQTTPSYSARLVGPRLFSPTVGELTVDLFADGILSIVNPAVDSFEINLVVVSTFPSALSFETAEEVSKFFGAWSVEWMAVE